MKQNLFANNPPRRNKNLNDGLPETKRGCQIYDRGIKEDARCTFVSPSNWSFDFGL